MKKSEIGNLKNLGSENRELMSDILEKEPRLREKFYSLIESINETYENKLYPSLLTYAASGLAITESIPEVILNSNTGIENYALLGAGVAVAAFGLKKMGRFFDKDWRDHVENADPSYRDILIDVEQKLEEEKRNNSVSKSVSDFVKSFKEKNTNQLGQKNARN